MPTFKLSLREKRTQDRWINVEVEAENLDAAAEAASFGYSDGKHDVALEEAEADTTSCEIELYHAVDGKLEPLF